jgi:hypothetical protein
MKKIIVLILLIGFQLNIVAQEKNDGKKIPCPLPKYKKGQTSAQVKEDTRNYIECKKNYQSEKANKDDDMDKREKERERQREQAEQRERNNNTPTQPSHQRNDPEKAAQQQAREERQRQARERAAEERRKKRERDGN